jgi:hypothetical protein
MQHMDVAQGVTVGSLNDGPSKLWIQIRADGKDFAQKTVIKPYFARLADKHQEAHLNFAAARE